MPKRAATSSSLAGINPSELNRVFDEATRRAVALVRREYPNGIGVMVHGSVARGEPGPFSDIDRVDMTRYAAQVIAQHVERVIIALNNISIISENYVWHQVLNATKRPSHLGIDYPIARGIRGTKETSKIYRSTLRLCSETLRIIRNDLRKKARHKRFRALLAEPLEKHGL